MADNLQTVWIKAVSTDPTTAAPPPLDPDAAASAGVVIPGLVEALLKMAELGAERHTLAEVGAAVDASLQGIMHLPNLFIALIDENPPRLRFVYCRDIHGRHVDRPINGLGLTDRVYLTQQSLLLRREAANELLASGDIVNHGVPSKVWLGVPLWSGERIVAVMATQDYDDSQNLTPWHEACMQAVAPTVAGLVDRAISWRERHDDSARNPQILRQKQALFATVGHDVRSPLAVIQGYSDLLRETLNDSSSALTAERIFKASQELAAATERMLDYTAAEAGARDHTPETTDLGGWMRSLESWLESWGESQGVGVSCHMTAPGGEYAGVDAAWLRQLLQHVIRVGLQAPAVSRVRLGLRVQPVVTIPAGLLRLSFNFEALAAPGALTPLEAQEGRLRPVQLDDGRTYDGVTVGLAIAKRLAEMIGADLKVSEPFHAPWRANLVMTVPAVIQAPTGEDEGGSQALAVMRKQLQHDTGKMVVMDANETTREELVALLRETIGAAPATVSSIKELVARLKSDPVSVIVAAVDTGSSGGREIALAMRAVGGHFVLPYFVAVSADQSPQGVEALLDSGADAYLPRPLNRAALIVALSDAWVEHQRRTEASTPSSMRES